MSIEAMKQALDVLLSYVEYDFKGNPLTSDDAPGAQAIDALEAAIEQAEKRGEGIYKTFDEWKAGNYLEDLEPREEAYTKDELLLVEMGWNYGFDAGRAAIEQAERPHSWGAVSDNALIEEVRRRGFLIRDAAVSTDKQEPVAWQDTAKHSELVAAKDWDNIDPQWHWMYRPLYTAPPQREWQGLTDGEIWNAWEHRHGGPISFARAIEAKLKEKNT